MTSFLLDSIPLAKCSARPYSTWNRLLQMASFIYSRLSFFWSRFSFLLSDLLLCVVDWFWYRLYFFCQQWVYFIGYKLCYHSSMAQPVSSCAIFRLARFLWKWSTACNTNECLHNEQNRETESLLFASSLRSATQNVPSMIEPGAESLWDATSITVW